LTPTGLNDHTPNQDPRGLLRSKVFLMIDDICLCTGLRQTAHAMTEIYDEALAPSGLKITMFRVMRRLSESDKPTISELAKIVGLDRSSLGRNLKVLEREELLTFVGGTDERSKVVQLTSKGRKALETALPLWRGVQKRMKSTLGSEKDAVIRVLSIVEAEMRSGR
jgi:DNA-binding MarR family transcriptional regulator